MQSLELSEQIAAQVADVVNGLHGLGVHDFLGAIDVILYEAPEGPRCGVACTQLGAREVSLAAVSLMRQVVRSLKASGATDQEMDVVFGAFRVQSEDTGASQTHLPHKEEENDGEDTEDEEPGQEDEWKDPSRRW